MSHPIKERAIAELQDRGQYGNQTTVVVVEDSVAVINNPNLIGYFDGDVFRLIGYGTAAEAHDLIMLATKPISTSTTKSLRNNTGPYILSGVVGAIALISIGLQVYGQYWAPTTPSSTCSQAAEADDDSADVIDLVKDQPRSPEDALLAEIDAPADYLKATNFIMQARSYAKAGRAYPQELIDNLDEDVLRSIWEHHNSKTAPLESLASTGLPMPGGGNLKEWDHLEDLGFQLQ